MDGWWAHASLYVPKYTASHLGAHSRQAGATQETDYRFRQVFNYLLGSAVRIFTTFQEVDDKLILYGFVAGFALNCVLAAQMVYYWNAPSTKVLGKRKEKAIAAQPASSLSSTSAAGAGPTSTATGTTPKKAPTTRRRG